jgi:tRNA G37 N-methylase TrmD
MQKLVGFSGLPLMCGGLTAAFTIAEAIVHYITVVDNPAYLRRRSCEHRSLEIPQGTPCNFNVEM